MFDPTAPDPYPAFVQRFVCGIDPGDVDQDIVVAWGSIHPISIQTTFTVLDDDLVEFLFGGGVIPLCARQLPTKGTE